MAGCKAEDAALSAPIKTRKVGSRIEEIAIIAALFGTWARDDERRQSGPLRRKRVIHGKGLTSFELVHS